jgi:hypothetical protein
VLSALASKIEGCKESLDAQAVGNALFGLKGMSSDRAEVLRVLSALAIKIEGCKESLSAQAVGNALFGLQGMSSDQAEVRKLLQSLHSKMSGKSRLTGQEAGMALYGLRSIVIDESWRGILQSLIQSLRDVSRSNDVSLLGDDVMIIQSAYQYVSLLLSDESCALMSRLSMLGLVDDLRDVKPSLRQKLEELEEMDSASCTSQSTPRSLQSQRSCKSRVGSLSKSSDTERRYVKVALEELQRYLANITTERKWCVVSEKSNKMLHGFDTDLVVFLRRGTEEEVVLNIEIDGPHHQRVTQKRFD